MMLWAGVSMHKRTAAPLIHRNLNFEEYQRQVLVPVVLPRLQAQRSMQLMHDGAPCHRSANTRRFLEENTVRIFPCALDLRILIQLKICGLILEGAYETRVTNHAIFANLEMHFFRNVLKIPPKESFRTVLPQ